MAANKKVYVVSKRNKYEPLIDRIYTTNKKAKEYMKGELEKAKEHLLNREKDANEEKVRTYVEDDCASLWWDNRHNKPICEASFDIEEYELHS